MRGLATFSVLLSLGCADVESAPAKCVGSISNCTLYCVEEGSAIATICRCPLVSDVCYAEHATCERQADGTCGFTKDAAFATCFDANTAKLGETCTQTMCQGPSKACASGLTCDVGSGGTSGVCR